MSSLAERGAKRNTSPSQIERGVMSFPRCLRENTLSRSGQADCIDPVTGQLTSDPEPAGISRPTGCHSDRATASTTHGDLTQHAEYCRHSGWIVGYPEVTPLF